MDMRELLLEIYNKQGYSELNSFIRSNPVLSNRENWKPYGGNFNNCGTFEGQQANPEAALVEKITNSIDAILMKECCLQGLNPQDSNNPNVPKSMGAAIERFFGIKNGKWENSSEKDRRKIASKLQLILTGSKQTPNIIIYDNGEGQNPTNFEGTFLSLHHGNKMNVPFVQGKFNMGSTGAVVFCGGDEKYQLIISRRCMSLDDSDGKIGFTLVRKHPLNAEEEITLKSTWYEYFTINGEIPSFVCESLDLGLNGIDFIDGSLIKLYSYELSRGCQSDATLDLWRELNALLYESIVPVLICEQRDYKGHSKTKLMLGNKTRISIDERENKYSTLSFSIKNIDTFGAEIPIEVTIFNPNIKNTEFIRRKSVVFLMNGQTQGSEGRTFISSDLGFRQLRENMLVSVDCTNVKTSVRNDIFMSSRDRMREGKNYDLLKQEIISLLKQDENLKNINQEFKGKILHESKDDKELIETLFSNLKSNKDIQNLFLGNNGFFSFATKKQKEECKSEIHKKSENSEIKQLKRFPSVFKVNGLKDIDGKKYKAIPKGGRGIIKFETDVENEFLTRNIDQGTLEISILDFSEQPHSGGGGTIYPSTEKERIKVQRSGPFNGEIKLIIEPDDSINVGDVFELSVKMISAAGEMEVIVFVKVEQEQKEAESKKQKNEPELNLPKAIRVFKEAANNDTITWDDCGMTASDIVKFEVGENNSIEEIRINMDSNLMKKEINKPNIKVEEVGTQYFSYIYAHSLMLYSILNSYYSQENNEISLDSKEIVEIKENLNKTLEYAFQYYGGFLMSFNNESAFLD